jgi:hypothetical protein
MKSPTNYKCEACKDTGYVSVKCLIEDYKRKCPCCYEVKINEPKRRKDDRGNN